MKGAEHAEETKETRVPASYKKWKALGRPQGAAFRTFPDGTTRRDFSGVRAKLYLLDLLELSLRKGKS